LKILQTVVLIASEFLVPKGKTTNFQAQPGRCSGNVDFLAYYASDMKSHLLRSSATQPHFGFGFEEPDPLNWRGRLQTQGLLLDVDYPIA
jgi:hypothetical protein